MFRSIIVPLDGSSFGEYALPFAVSIARRTGATLRLVHVHRTDPSAERLESIPDYQYQRIAEHHFHADQRLRREEDDALWSTATRFAEEGIPTTAHLLSGRVPDAISGFAREHGDALIVMSTHGTSGFQRLWLGSVADAVVRRSLTPVLLVRPNEDATPPDRVDLRRVLVPVDGSARSSEVLGPVAWLAGNEPIAITLLEADPPPDPAAVAFSPIWPAGRLPPRQGPSARSPEEIARRLPPELGSVEVKRVKDRNPAHAILEETDAGGYDLVAMATHGLGGAHHLLLGSTADKVMRGTDKPILLYRPHRRTGVPAEDYTDDRAAMAELFIA